MADREGAIPVLNDAQFGLTSILRPYKGFDTQPGGVGGEYQNLPGSIPIMFTEGGVALDPASGQPGYSKRLLKGLSVPYGARVGVWLPSLSMLTQGTDVLYQWVFVWRLRNVFDYRQQRLAFHYPKQGVGQPSTEVGDAGPRVVLPVCMEAVVVNADGTPAFVLNSTGAAISTLAIDMIEPNGFALTAPLIPPPGGFVFLTQGLFGQGLFDPVTAFAQSQAVNYLHYEMQAKGDELLIGALKTTATHGASSWDFTSILQDAIFSSLFGAGAALGPAGPFPDIGVYVHVGVAT